MAVFPELSPRPSVPKRPPQRLGSFLFLLTSALAVGCTGNIGETQAGATRDGPTGSPSGSPSDPIRASDGGALPPTLASCATQRDVGESLLRRLSNTELQLTLQDLFQLPSPPSLTGVPADNEKEGFKTFTEVQPLSAQHLRAYATLSGELADALFADAARRTAVVGCAESAAGCLEAFTGRFGRLAFRRTLEAQEVEALTARAVANALDVRDQYRFVVQSLLTSPNFLYRVEVGDTPDGLSTLTPSELATRLSFALWGRGPSAALLDDAESGALDTPEGLQTVAREMLGDARAQVFYEGFFRQWLGYDKLRAPNVKPAGWSDALLVDMQKETDLALARHAFGTGSLLDALSGNQTQVSAPLAALYGLPAPRADGSLTIPGTHHRANAGILGHASLLSLKSDGDMIALRGNWLRRTFFCASLTIPPDVAADLGDLLVGLSRVEIVKKRNTEAACKGCHARIDPIGVGLAAFDAIGMWDPTEDITQYGITPALPDVESPSFDSLATLATKLREAPEVAACLTEKVFLYVGGREPNKQDQCALTGTHASFAEGGNGFRALLSGLVSSESFRLRRAPAPDTSPSTSTEK